MKKTLSLLLMLLGSLLLFAQSSSPDTYYVNGTTGNDGNDGRSWTAAFQTLQKALSTAGNGDEVWVAAGTYYPDEGPGQTDNRRESAFNLIGGVQIYGGFTGTETELSQRSWTSRVTTLSGDLLKNDGSSSANNADNAYHVVRGVSLDHTAALDGFTIKGGNADGYYSTEYDNGGGLYNYASSPTIANCTFVQNYASYGGAVHNDQGSSPILSYCDITQNTAGANGGGLFNDNASSPTLTYCQLSENKAHQGAAIYNNHSSSPVVTNCSFSSNTAQAEGGGLYNYNTSSPTLTNCSFWSNTAGRGGGLYNFSASPTIINGSFWGNSATSGGGALAGQSAYPTLVNCILWGNSSTFYEVGGSATVSYSIIQGGYSGTANLEADPRFRNAAGGDLRLQFSSPAKDAGNNAAVTVDSDLDRHPRIQYGRVDMGAYEFRPGDPGSTVYVHPDGNDANDGATWATALRTVQKALSRTNSGQIWVAAGTYYPDEIDNTNSNNTAASFVLQEGGAMYGGFAGTETLLSERNWNVNETILSGDINQDGGFGGNSNTVVTTNVFGTLLDGFTITRGYALSDWPWKGGGGMFNEAQATVVNCTFKENGAYGYYSYGGAVFNNSAYPTFINCKFWGNSASHGGAIFNLFCDWGNSKIINCTFAYNSGGAIFNKSASPLITNTILWGNSGYQMANDYTSIEYKNNPVVSYSLVQGGWGGTNNLSTDPLFVNAAGGNLHLQGGSPAIDAGNDAAVPATVTTDLTGYPRKQGLHVDMGAYEYVSTSGDHPPGPYQPLILVCPDNITLESAAGACGAFIDFDAAQLASVDGGTPPITVTYAPASGNPLPVGENTITVTATDSTGATKTCSFIVTVVDATPPVLTPPFPGVDVFGAHTDPDACWYTTPGSRLDITATDNCPGPLFYYYSLSGATSTDGPVEASTLSGVPFNRGETLVHYLVRDGAGNEATYTLKVIISDYTLPRITGVSVDRPVLYPPNHQMQNVTVNYEATDNCPGVTTTLSVSSNEAADSTGDGHTSGDWQVIDDHHVQLRAERSGTGTDRIYTLTIIAKDASGFVRAARTTVTVPHDKKAPVTMNEAINSKEVDGLQVTAVPNPSSEGFTLTIQSPSDLPVSIKVIDAAGRVIEQKDRIAANGTLRIGSPYRPGVYYVQVEQGSVRQTLKLVKQTH